MAHVVKSFFVEDKDLFVLHSQLHDNIVVAEALVTVTVKTFELLQDGGWIWLDFPGFKHYYMKEVYPSDVCFAVCGQRTGDFHCDCGYARSQGITCYSIDIVLPEYLRFQHQKG